MITDTGQYIPDVEQSIIGLVVYGERANEIFAEVDESEIKDFAYNAIFKRFKQLWQERGKVNGGDLVSLNEDLKIIGFNAAQGVISTDPKQYISALKERNACSQAQVIAGQLMFVETLEDINKHTEELHKILRGNIRTESVGMKEALNKFNTSKGVRKNYIKTGYSTLDKFTYIEKGDYLIVGARSSNGKTAFALNLCVNMAKKGYKVGFFSFETNADKLFDRIVSNVAAIPLANIKRGDLLPEEWLGIAEVRDVLEGMNVLLIPSAGKDTAFIRSETARNNLDIAIVDYLGLISAQGKSLYEKATNATHELHTFAQSTGTVVIALSQLNRQAAKGEPTLADLRESGAIEESADVVLLLHSPPTTDGMDDKPRNAKLIIAKNKEGGCGAISMMFNGSQMRFTERTEE